MPSIHDYDEIDSFDSYQDLSYPHSVLAGNRRYSKHDRRQDVRNP